MDILPSSEVVNGVAIRRCWGPSFGRGSFYGRFLDMASFSILAVVRMMFAPRVETVVFLTNPPLFSLLGALMKRIRKERFVYILMDIYPDIAIHAGVLREGAAVTRFLRRVSRVALRGADRVVVLGDDMREVAIRAGAASEKVVVIRNWADHEKINPLPKESNRLRREWGLNGKFIVEYSGNMGISHFFDDILAVAEELEEYDDIRFVFIGGGMQYREVKSYVASKKLTNVIFTPYQEKSMLSLSLSAGDVHFVSLRPGFEGLVVPSKAYGVMAAGRPMIYQGDGKGEIAKMVRREEIGFVVGPGDRAGLRDAILALYKDKEMGTRMGEMSRRALEAKYSSSVGLAQYSRVLAGKD